MSSDDLHYGFEPRLPVDNETGGICISNSDITGFKTCRRQWYLGGMLGLRDRHQKVHGPLVLGTRVHDALESHYGMGQPLVESYNDIATEELNELRRSGIVFDESAWMKEAELGRIMLEGFAQWAEETGFNSEFSVTGTEQKITHRTRIGDQPVSLRGKIDLRVKIHATGQNMIMDWKTTARFAYLTKGINLNEQIKMYMMLERLKYKDDGVDDTEFLQGGALVMLLKTKRTGNAKPPFYDVIEVSHSKQMMNSFYRQTIGTATDYVRVVNQLSAGADPRMVAYPTPGSQCDWCPFKSVCQIMDDTTRTQDMLHDLYTQGDPHERYKHVPDAKSPSEYKPVKSPETDMETR